MSAPPGLHRLFADWGGVPPLPADPLVTGRVLEDGDEADLRWLCRELGEDGLRRWLRQRGGRQLSTRSRAFWRLLLDVEASAPELVEELWSL